MFSADVSSDFDTIRSRIQQLLAQAPTRLAAVSLETALLVLTSVPRSKTAGQSHPSVVPARADDLFLELDLLLALAGQGAHRRDAVICRMWVATAQRHWTWEPADLAS